LGKILGKDSGVRVDLLTFDYEEAMKAGTEKGNGSGASLDLLIFDYKEAMKAGRRALGMDSGFERPKMIRCLLDSWLP